MAVGFHLLGHLHRVPGPGDGVVGVHKQDGAGGERVGVGPEGLQLGRKTGYERVRHGACWGHTIDTGGQHVAGGSEPCDVAGAGHLKRRVSALGPAGGEVGDTPSLGGPNATGGLGGQHALEVNLIDDEGLDKLGFDQRGRYLNRRFVGEVEPSFRNGPDAAGKPDTSQKLKEVVGEDAHGAQIVYGPSTEVKIGEIVQHI